MLRIFKNLPLQEAPLKKLRYYIISLKGAMRSNPKAIAFFLNI